MSELKELLAAYRDGNTSLEETVTAINESFFQVASDATIDVDRHRRTGSAEVIYAERKTPDQVASAFQTLADSGNNVLATRVYPEAYDALAKLTPTASYNQVARVASLVQNQPVTPETSIAVVTAGTSDLTVAEEASATAEFYGNEVHRITDVGVAGIHRLLHRVEELRGARVIVVIAGMEGALPSVVGGLVDKPIIAVPTSVGYGAAFGGIAALLGMLTSCAPGVSVVNIDNGFGAGYIANVINRL